MKAVALGGGGDKGAFSVGVLKRLYNKGESFEIISGTSTGALIASLLAIDEIDELWELYAKVKKEDVLRENDLVSGVLTGNALFDTEPLWRLITRTITEEKYKKIMNSGKKIFISTVCLQNLRSTYFTNTDHPGSRDYDVIKWNDREQFMSAILASAVQPVLMPPVLMNRLQYVDGGVRTYLPSEVVIDAGATDITAIMTVPDNYRYIDVRIFDNVKDILLKTIEIFSNEVGENDLKLTQLNASGATFLEELKKRIRRNTGLDDDVLDALFTSAANPFFGKKEIALRVIRPSRSLGDGLSFTNMEEMLALGYDAPDSVTTFYA